MSDDDWTFVSRGKNVKFYKDDDNNEFLLNIFKGNEFNRFTIPVPSQYDISEYNNLNIDCDGNVKGNCSCIFSQRKIIHFHIDNNFLKNPNCMVDGMYTYVSIPNSSVEITSLEVVNEIGNIIITPENIRNNIYYPIEDKFYENNDMRHNIKYVGYMRKGLYHGSGTATIDDNILQGQWYMNQFKSGQIIDGIGNVYSGIFLNKNNNNTRPEKCNEYLYVNKVIPFNSFYPIKIIYNYSAVNQYGGSTYIGHIKLNTIGYNFNFSDFLKHGTGTMTYINGDVFSGKWNDNYQQFGTMTYANGDIYTGQWFFNKRHGKGQFISNNSTSTSNEDFPNFIKYWKHDGPCFSATQRSYILDEIEQLHDKNNFKLILVMFNGYEFKFPDLFDMNISPLLKYFFHMTENDNENKYMSFKSAKDIKFCYMLVDFTEKLNIINENDNENDNENENENDNENDNDNSQYPFDLLLQILNNNKVERPYKGRNPQDGRTIINNLYSKLYLPEIVI